MEMVVIIVFFVLILLHLENLLALVLVIVLMDTITLEQKYAHLAITHVKLVHSVQLQLNATRASQQSEELLVDHLAIVLLNFTMSI